VTETANDIEQLIELYQSIEHASRAMLSAALDGDWESVAREQAHCSTLIEQTRRLVPGVTLTRAQQQTRLRILQRILQNEAIIRNLAHPWTERLEQLLAAPSAGSGPRTAWSV